MKVRLIAGSNAYALIEGETFDMMQLLAPGRSAALSLRESAQELRDKAARLETQAARLDQAAQILESETSQG